MHMSSKLIDVIIYAGAVQGFFLALLLNAGKYGKRRSNRILSLLPAVRSVP